jgi:two-component system response regulator FlrC
MSQRRILIVGEQKLYVKALADTLASYQHQVDTISDSGAAIGQLEKQAYDLLLCEESMTPVSGRELLQLTHSMLPELPVVLMTDFGTVERAVSAMREGAADYLVKPIDTEFLLELVARVTRDTEPKPPSDDIIAKDPYSLELLKLARKVAANEVSVLISGESGTGKEVLARYIHKHSPRHAHPFVAINCAAIPENMLEAVLFGHEKGAYTGAIQSNPGKFEMAQGGTLLLDEISEMDLGLQAKLLRVLQEREVERLGGRKTISLDVRVLATTNRRLAEEVSMGNFREDLYYRLNVFPMRLAPLRDRIADILPLARQMVRLHTMVGQAEPTLTEEAGELLEGYPWPGNVRELGNVIQRALVLCNGYEIRAEDLHFEATSTLQSNLSGAIVPGMEQSNLTTDMKSHEFDLILKALQNGNGSRKKAAEQLGISPRTLRYKLAKMRERGIELPAA